MLEPGRYDEWLLTPRPAMHLHPLDAAWIAQLDVDLELAQAMLRRPLEERPWPEVVGVATTPEPPPPPAYSPPVRHTPQQVGPRPESLVPTEGGKLSGAYARRAAAMKPPSE